MRQYYERAMTHLGLRPMAKFLYDEDVLPSVIKLAKSARSQLVLVSPYNDFSVNLHDVVVQMAKRVCVTAVCRSDRKQKEKEHLDWLIGLGVRVYLVKRLHSKIYLNESQAIVTSMNLLKESAVDSKEVALRVQGTEEIKEINNYISRLLANAEPYSGYCIRCGNGISFEPERPLCGDCYKKWAHYRNPDYPERHCHRCGLKSRTSLAKPQCLECFKETR